MKILFICENYLPHYGGAEVVFKNLAENFVKKDHKVSLITHRLKGTREKENIGGVNVHRVNSFFSRYIFTFFSIPKALKLARQHDIVQTTTFNGAFPAWLAAKLTGKPVVLTVHEVWVGKWKQVTGFNWWKSMMHDLLERCIYMLPFDKYVCVSNATRKDLAGVGISGDRAVTIHNGMDYQVWDTANFKEERIKEIRTRLGLNEKFVYFSWGRPGASKGFEYVIKAVPIIKMKLPNSLFLLMLGSANKYKKKYNQLIRLVKELRLDDSIKIIPSVPYGELGNYLSAVDCVVVPSVAEGFGYTTVEAVTMGKPVVASDAGSIPEVIGGRHLLFRSKDVIGLADGVVKAAKGECRKTAIKRFDWETSVQRYLDIYLDFFGNNYVTQ